VENYPTSLAQHFILGFAPLSQLVTISVTNPSVVVVISTLLTTFFVGV
jgi:hypothetical protein